MAKKINGCLMPYESYIYANDKPVQVIHAEGKNVVVESMAKKLALTLHRLDDKIKLKVSVVYCGGNLLMKREQGESGIRVIEITKNFTKFHNILKNEMERLKESNV